MIRPRDQFRLSIQKIGLRKKRAAFSIISVALGVVILVTVNSLVRGIRDMIVRTGYTEEIDADTIRVSSEQRFSGMSADFSFSSEPSQPKRQRMRFLTNDVLAKIRAWKEVEAATTDVTVALNVDEMAEMPRASSRGYANGVPDVLMRRYADAKQLAACERAIPLLLGERFVKLRYNEKTKKFDLESAARAQAWIGREVSLRLGDPLAQLERFRFDREKKQWLRRSEEEMAQQRKSLESASSSDFDKTIHNRSLTLRGRVVGFCPGSRLLIPEDAARQCAKWLKQRDDLARLNPVERPPENEYGEYGRRVAREGEFTQALVVLKAGTNPEQIVKRLREMGFEATTRQNAFESFLKEVDASMKIAKRIVYAIGGVLLLIACGLLWSTTSRIVSDSRVDIGLFRAIGATKADVRRLFLTETAWLGLIGTIVGTALGWTAAYWISRGVIHLASGEVSDPEETLLIPRSIFAVDWTFCVLLVVGAVAVSLLAGLWPANRAANIDPVKALKRE